MFTLITDRSKYFKVKRGQGLKEIEGVLNTPVCGEPFAGRIIKVAEVPLFTVTADVGDSYRTIAQKYGVPQSRLMEINGCKPVYPTCKIFVPKK